MTLKEMTQITDDKKAALDDLRSYEDAIAYEKEHVPLRDTTLRTIEAALTAPAAPECILLHRAKNILSRAWESRALDAHHEPWVVDMVHDVKKALDLVTRAAPVADNGKEGV
jgi:phosphoribosylaminoimidazole carboxylase (NCAIR synthetase)